MIRFNDDNTIALTKGQKELVDAGIAAGLCRFEMSSNDVIVRIKLATALVKGEAVTVEAQWLPTGRFHACFVSTAGGNEKTQTLKGAIGALERHAQKAKRARKAA